MFQAALDVAGIHRLARLCFQIDHDTFRFGRDLDGLELLVLRRRTRACTRRALRQFFLKGLPLSFSNLGINVQPCSPLLDVEFHDHTPDRPVPELLVTSLRVESAWLQDVYQAHYPFRPG